MREGWEYKKLGEIASFINGDRGKNYPSAKDFVEDGVPFINAGHLCNGIINFDKMNYITYNKYSSLGSGKIQQHDILFCLRGSLGKFAIVKEKSLGAIASSLVIIRPSQIVDDRFIAHFLSTPKLQEYIDSNNNGSSQPNLSAKSVASFIIPLPPKSTQLSIVSELDKINELIRLKKEQLKDYDNLAQSIFYEMFGDPVENEKGWEVKKIGEIGSVERGAGISKKDFVEDGLPCIHYGQLHTILGARTKKHYTSIPHDLLPKYKVAHTGDLVMAITSEDVEGSCKSTAWLGNYDVIVGSDAAILHHEQDGTFLSYYTMTKAFYNEKAKYAKGFKVTHISTKEIEKISVFLPPLPLQHLFAQRIEQIERQKSAVQKSITDLKTLLASRMQYWFE